MKKFYETPAVEFTGFNAEDVITTSIVNTYEAYGETPNAAFENAVKANNVADAAVSYGSYQW